MPGSPTKSKTPPPTKEDLIKKIKEEAGKLNARVTINPDGTIILGAKSLTGVTLTDGVLNNYYKILKQWSDPLVNMIMQNNDANDTARTNKSLESYYEKKQKETYLNISLANNWNLQELTSKGYSKEEIIEGLLKKNTTLQQFTAFGFSKEDILTGLVNLGKTPEQIFNSGYEITYGAIKEKFGKTAALLNWENSIEGSDKCVKQGIAGFGSKSTCYIKDGKYISKGGRRKRSVRRQYRRSRKVSRK
jgi:hypothetical protein